MITFYETQSRNYVLRLSTYSRQGEGHDMTLHVLNFKSKETAPSVVITELNLNNSLPKSV